MIDVVIVGGGVSGLTCYRRIKKSDRNLNVKILEAKGESILVILRYKLMLIILNANYGYLFSSMVIALHLTILTLINYIY